MLRVDKGKVGAEFFCRQAASGYHVVVRRLTIILPAINFFLYILTAVLNWRFHSPYVGRALSAIDIPWSTMMVSSDSDRALAIASFMGTAWWYFIARIGSDSRNQKISRANAFLGAVLVLCVLALAGWISVEYFVEDLRTSAACPFLIQYLPAALLCVGAFVSLSYALAGAFKKRTSPDVKTS